MTARAILKTLGAAGLFAAALGLAAGAAQTNGGRGMMGDGSGYGMMGGNGYGTMNGYGPGYGMMGRSGYGCGMMNGAGPGYGMMNGYGPGMMGGGYGHGWMMNGQGPGYYGQARNLNLSVDDVKKYVEQMIDNPRLKVGDVKEKSADTITAEVVTKDKDALVQTFAFDRHTGGYQPEQ